MTELNKADKFMKFVKTTKIGLFYDPEAKGGDSMFDAKLSAKSADVSVSVKKPIIEHEESSSDSEEVNDKP